MTQQNQGQTTFFFQRPRPLEVHPSSGRELKQKGKKRGLSLILEVREAP